MELCEIDICFFCLLILNSTINKTLETFCFWEKYAESDFAKLTIVILTEMINTRKILQDNLSSL